MALRLNEPKNAVQFPHMIEVAKRLKVFMERGLNLQWLFVEIKPCFNIFIYYNII